MLLLQLRKAGLFKELFPGKGSHQGTVVLTCVRCNIQTEIVITGTYYATRRTLTW